jgi:acyl-CoA synthetase (NDP forming)
MDIETFGESIDDKESPTGADNASRLDVIFHPRSVAVVGVSSDQRGFAGAGARFITGLREMGFPVIYPVNPKYDEIQGLKCYGSILEIDGPVDHVISSLPAALVPQLVEDSVTKGVRCIHFFTAGFSETGDEKRAELEGELAARARQAGIHILGPNCMGLYVPGSKLAFADGFPPEPGPVTFISQSGGNADAMVRAAARRGIRFSKVVSYGNAAGISESDLLDYLAEDPETEIIGAYIEGIKDGRRFLKAMRKAASSKPLIVLKGGRTQSGTRAVRSHTGSLAGSTQIFEAACRQAGALHVKNLDEMVDVTVALRYAGIPRGPRVVVVGGGGGLSVFAADEIDEAGLTCPSLPEAIQARLQEFTPAAGTSVRNPVDAIDLFEPSSLRDTLEVVAPAESIDLIMCHANLSWGGGGRSTIARRFDAVVTEMSKAGQAAAKPVIVAVSRDSLYVEAARHVQALQEKCWRAGIAVFPSIPRACNAIAKLLVWSHTREA